MKTEKINALLLFQLFAVSNLYAQLAATNSGNLQLHAGASIRVFGNFTNNSSGVLVNNGDLYLSSNFTNNEAAMTAGTGTLFLNAGSAQTIDGTATVKTYNLVTNTSGGITLNTNLSVSGVHTFAAGLIHTSAAPNYMVYETGSSYTGDADARHVTGWVKKYGATSFTFPVGNATYERTASVASLGSSSEIDCHYYAGTQNIYNLNPPLIAVDSNEYWSINKISGGNFKVNLNWDNSKVHFYNVLLADVLVAEYSTALWRSLGGSASGSPATTGTVNGTANVLTSVSTYTFGFTTYPLPLKLITFSGYRASGVSILHWAADQEINAGNYEVQRSTNGLSFIAVGSVAARNSGNPENYEFRDDIRYSGIMYYRLKMQDASGKSCYSSVINLAEQDRNTGLFIIPNPVTDNIIVINRSLESGEYMYTLYNSSGQKVKNGMAFIHTGSQSIIPLPPVSAAGIYTLELRNSKTSFRQQILVKK